MPLAVEPRRSDALASQIRSAIADKTLSPGSRLPSERVLCEQFGVSRTTVRRAVAELSAAGLVRSEPGRGTFVVAVRIGEDPNALSSFTELGVIQGLRPSSTVLQAEVLPASLDDAQVFTIAPGAPLFHLRRLRQLDGLPVSVDRNRIPLVRVPRIAEVDFSSASLYAVLAAAGHQPVRADYTIEAAEAEAAIARTLDVPAGSPLLSAQTLSTDGQGQVVEAGDMLYRADRYRFRATLQRRDQQTLVAPVQL